MGPFAYLIVCVKCTSRMRKFVVSYVQGKVNGYSVQQESSPCMQNDVIKAENIYNGKKLTDKKVCHVGVSWYTCVSG